jgi:rRNA maturation endonuclease Nob1
MTGGSLSLVLGTVLALGALSYVLWPLLNERAPSLDDRRRRTTSVPVDEESLATSALREIEFDRATGKLSDTDYEELKDKYTRLAAEEARVVAVASGAATATVAGRLDVVALAAAAPDDPVEAAVRAVQSRRPSCPTCGPRPESDATYCSGCGHFLPGACAACGASVAMPGARFCNACGVPLAA